ncbi:MAG: MFS transporter [Anaerolineae bacterium]|nr:MFS transporter [Anaerolineae bacterium]
MNVAFQRILRYLDSLRSFNRNCWLLFAAITLNGIAQGIFLVIFNLYILSMGIGSDVLGAILSAAPFAQAIISIPISLLGEVIGFKRAFLLTFALSGVAKLVQAATPNVPLIALAAFVDGLALSGSFVIRLPFLAANTGTDARTRVFSVNSILFSLSLSLGSLFASFLPNLFQSLTPNLTLAYRYTLYVAGGIALLAMLPTRALASTSVVTQKRPQLRDYLWQANRLALQQGVVALFVGIGLGIVGPFMNLFFIYHLGTTREFYGAVSALAVIPAILGTLIIPRLATRARSPIGLITFMRMFIPVFLIGFALTANPWWGTFTFWGQNALFFMIQPIAFAFAMNVGDSEAPVVSAWLNTAYWIGNAIAAPVTGAFFAQGDYRFPLYLASVAVIISGVFNQLFFAPLERRLREGVV